MCLLLLPPPTPPPRQVFSFRFVTVFASLYYYAFLNPEASANYKLFRLATSLFTFMTIGQWWYMVSPSLEQAPALGLEATST